MVSCRLTLVYLLALSPVKICTFYIRTFYFSIYLFIFFFQILSYTSSLLAQAHYIPLHILVQLIIKYLNDKLDPEV